MAASHVVKLKKGDKVTSLLASLKEHFSHKGDDAKGELTAKVDGSVKISYKVQGESATFTVAQAPKLFSDGDQKRMLKEFFG